jgi:hypothetical protein
MPDAVEFQLEGSGVRARVDVSAIELKLRTVSVSCPIPPELEEYELVPDFDIERMVLQKAEGRPLTLEIGFSIGIELPSLIGEHEAQSPADEADLIGVFCHYLSHGAFEHLDVVVQFPRLAAIDPGYPAKATWLQFSEDASRFWQRLKAADATFERHVHADILRFTAENSAVSRVKCDPIVLDDFVSEFPGWKETITKLENPSEQSEEEESEE